jgi:hypothetical protein
MVNEAGNYIKKIEPPSLYVKTGKLEVAGLLAYSYLK